MNAYEFIVKMKDHATSGLRNIAQSAGVADDRLEGLNREAKRSEGSFTGLKRTLATVFTVAAIVGFVSKVIEARAEYEKFRAVLTNTFQSQEQGDAALAMLTDFAAKTPFALNELTGAYIKLVNRGIIPTEQSLTNLGDLAASQGKGFDQLAEAVLDAGSGEFERMKEFGIKASKSGDLVTLSFKGINKEVANNATAIQQAIEEYGRMPGVAGSMDAISKTLGGRINNLGDQWNQFLVAVGGETGGVISGFIDIVSAAIAFLTDHLAEISMWFELLWSYISPVIESIWNFIKAALGIGEASSVLAGFGNVMRGVLMIVDFLTTGLSFLIDILTPIAPWILAIAAAWTVWNYALVVYNALMLVSPTTWIIYGIIALIGVIGMVIKYTSDWGSSWQALKKVFSLVWDQIKADFQFGVDSFKNGFSMIILSGENAAQKIVGRFSKVGEAIKMALDGDFSGAWDKAFETVNTKSEEEMKKVVQNQSQMTADWAKDRASRSKELNEERLKVGFNIDTDGMGKDWDALKKKFSGAGIAGDSGSNAYDDYLAKKKAEDEAKGTKEGKKAGDTIVSGGTKHTNIYVTIQKLQDDTKIYVSAKEEGLQQLGEKVQEVLLRAVNSVNQMQTS